MEHENSSENLERRTRMSAVSEASHLMRRIAEPVSAGESIKALINRAARLTGINSSRAKAIWYQETRRIDAEEIDRLREVAAARAQKREALAHHDLHELRSRIARIERLLAASDTDGHRESLAALRGALGASDGADGADDRAVD